MRIAPAITLSPDQRTLAATSSKPVASGTNRGTSSYRVVGRQRLIRQERAASMLKVTPKKVARWRQRFLTLGMAGLERDAPRPGRTPTISASVVRRVVSLTTRQKPPNATHWSTRRMAAAVGISEASVRRIWHSHGLKPHRVESFKISNDPEFAEKLEDIVGLYLNPPEHALVLCVDEKSQIQALDRTPTWTAAEARPQPDHDPRLQTNGTATLFAALNAANGEVYALCQERHRHQEWLRFLRLLEQTMPAHLDLHLIGATTPPKNTPKSNVGSNDTHVFICTSLLPVRRG